MILAAERETMVAVEKNILFFPPEWFRKGPYASDRPGEVCYSHFICKQVDRDLRLLRPQVELQPKVVLADDEVGKEAAPEEIVEEVAKTMVVEEVVSESAMVVEEIVDVEEMVVSEKKKMHKEEDEVFESHKKNMKEEGKGKEPKKSPSMKTMDEMLKRLEVCHYTWNASKLYQDSQPHDIPKLLSSETENKYLIRNDGTHVDIKTQLSGKYLVLYFGWLHHPYLLCHVGIADLTEIYEVFKKQLEVVFVALGEGNAAFDDFFSKMPWLAIPYKDEKARQQFVHKFSIPRTLPASCVLLDPQGTVLRCDVEIFFRLYGVEGFPFSNEKIYEIDQKDDALRNVAVQEEVSLTVLLGANVISMKRGKVPTSELEGKVVGLHFFEPTTDGLKRTRELVEFWNSVKEKQHKEFVVVVIYGCSYDLEYAEAEFKKEFKHIDWYSLPIDGRYLCRLFRVGIPHDHYIPGLGYFIIIEPGRPTLSVGYFAYDIWQWFGSGAYPFTPEKAAMVWKKSEQEGVVLNELLSLSAHLRRGRGLHEEEEDTSLWHLWRKKVPILLLFATYSCYESVSFLTWLKQMYVEKKGTSDYFEIIYISLDCEKSPFSFDSCIQEMPWLVHTHVPQFSVELLDQLFDISSVSIPAIAAFGSDGHLVSRESNLALKTDMNSEYPFITDLVVEVRKDLKRRHRWDLKQIFPDISSEN